MTETCEGVDVTKGWIDVYDPQRGSFRVDMERAAFQVRAADASGAPV